MRVIVNKLIRDFWQAKGKLVLCLVAACLSAWGISTMVYSYLMAERDFEINFATTLPADFEILVDDYKPGLEELFLNAEHVVDLERREIVGGRVKAAEGHWMQLQLFAVEDIDNMRMDVFKVLEMPEQKEGALLIEVNANTFLDDNLDSLEIQFDGDKSVIWKKSGISHDPRLAPARMERAVYAQITSIKMIEPYLKPGRRRFLVDTDVSMDKGELQKVSRNLALIAESAGSEIVYVNIPEPGKHMHQNIVDGISFLQESTGLIISGMGVVLLSLILLTWILPQVSEVGVMKAIGASTRKIFYGYCVVLLMIILLGMAIGMPLGYQTAKQFNGIIAYVQNFQTVETILPVPYHILVVLIGLIIPFFVGAIPLFKASRTTVHEAMNKTFYIPGKAIFRAFQNLISGVEKRYGVNNLFRNSARTALIVALTAVGIGLYFTGANFEYSIHSEMERFGEETKYAIRMRFANEMKIKEVDYLNDLPFVEQIAPMKDVRVTYRPPNAAFTETRVMRRLSPDHVIEESFVLEGELDANCADCFYISGEGIKDEFRETDFGMEVEFTLASGEKKTYRYAGIFKDMAAIGSPFFVFDNEPDSFNALAFMIDKTVPSYQASDQIDDKLLDNGIDVAGTMNVDLRLASLEGHLEPTYVIIKSIGLFTILIGFLSLLIVLNLTIQERTREIGVLKSIGSSFRKVSSLFQKEFMLVNLFSIALGVLVAIPLTSSLCRVFGQTVIYHDIPSSIDWMGIGLATFIILLIQTALITLFNRMKLRKNARALLDFNF